MAGGGSYDIFPLLSSAYDAPTVSSRMRRERNSEVNRLLGRDFVILMKKFDVFTQVETHDRHIHEEETKEAISFGTLIVLKSTGIEDIHLSPWSRELQ